MALKYPLATALLTTRFAKLYIWMTLWLSFLSLGGWGLWTMGRIGMAQALDVSLDSGPSSGPNSGPSSGLETGVSESGLAQRSSAQRSSAQRSLAQRSLAQRSSAQHNPQSVSTLLFVNPAMGNDELGEGSQRSPFRSLTRALTIAESGTVIMLSPGQYSAETGEDFPIQLKAGVTVQGDPNSLGEGIVISGGGRFLSPTFASQNITLLAADDAVLTGVTVTNPNSRGYGLWIESSRPTVTRNTFRSSLHDGISITGAGQAMIQGNHFHHNGANGITIYGTSQPTIQGNVFEDTGFGINIGQQAAPQLVDNRVWNNRSGIIVQGKARPVLRRNVVEFNQQDGLVAIAQSQPDLGHDHDPGQNRFSDNGQSDINAEVAIYPLVSIGNTLNFQRTLGHILTTMPPTRIADGPTGHASSVQASGDQIADVPSGNASSVQAGGDRIADGPTGNAPSAQAGGDRSILSILADVPPIEPATIPAALLPDGTNPGITNPGRPNLAPEAEISPVAASPVADAQRDLDQSENAEELHLDNNSPIPLAVIPPLRSSPASEPSLSRSPSTLSTPSALTNPSLNRSPSTPSPLSALTNPSLASAGNADAREDNADTSIHANASIDADEPGAIDIPVFLLSSSLDRTAPLTGNTNPSTTLVPNSRSTGQASTGQVVTGQVVTGQVITRQAATEQAALPTQPSPSSVNLPSIPIAATPEQDRNSTAASSLPTERPQNLLPVPGVLAPSGHLGNLSTVPLQPTSLNNALLSTVPSMPTSQRTTPSLHYRVLVEANTQADRTLVTTLVPDAFTTRVEGRTMIQIGAYRQLKNANDMAYQLVDHGLHVEVQRIE